MLPDFSHSPDLLAFTDKFWMNVRFSSNCGFGITKNESEFGVTNMQKLNMQESNKLEIVRNGNVV